MSERTQTTKERMLVKVKASLGRVPAISEMDVADFALSQLREAMRGVSEIARGGKGGYGKSQVWDAACESVAAAIERYGNEKYGGGEK